MSLSLTSPIKIKALTCCLEGDSIVIETWNSYSGPAQTLMIVRYPDEIWSPNFTLRHPHTAHSPDPVLQNLGSVFYPPKCFVWCFVWCPIMPHISVGKNDDRVTFRPFGLRKWLRQVDAMYTNKILNYKTKTKTCHFQ